MQLSARSIHNLCCEADQQDLSGLLASRLAHPKTGDYLPMIKPFVPTRQIINGKSYGLSAASYDLRIAHDLTLEPHPGYMLLDALRVAPASHPDAALAILKRYARDDALGRCFALAHTIEDFAIPKNISAQICDKSTYARLGVSCFNTFFDPGFIGNGTLELVNLSPRTIIIRSGDPIAQMVFNWLDQETDRPYDGKYQFQPQEPVAAIMEPAA